MKKVLMSAAIVAMMVAASSCTCCNKKAEEAKAAGADFVGLDEEDYKHLEKHIMHMSTRKYPLGYPMLVQCEY